MMLSAGSGVAALIYEVVWFQLLELVIGSTAVSLSVLLATFMGGMCLGSLLLPRLVSGRYHPLRVYAALEIGVGALGILVLLLLMPLASGVYGASSGYGAGGFLLRGGVAAACLLPPTLLMGATLPALARTSPPTQQDVSWIGLLYGANIGGAVFGSLLPGFYLLREYDTATATYVAVATNMVIGGTAFVLGKHRLGSVPPSSPRIAIRNDTTVYIAIALSGLCALASEAIWTRLLGLLFGGSVYTFSIIVAVFLCGLGIGSGAGALLCRILSQPRTALGVCQLLAAGAIAWAAYNVSASLPYWPVDPSVSSSIWFNFALDVARASWALLPATLLWGASFPLALAAVSPKGDGARLFGGVYVANALGAIAGALGASLLMIAWVGSQRSQQMLIGLSTIAGLLLVSSSTRIRWAVMGSAVLLGGLWIYIVPPLAEPLVAHGRFAASWAGRGDIIYANEGLNASLAVSRFPNGALTFHVAGKIQASNVPRDMRLQRMLGHLTTLTAQNPRTLLVIGCGAGITAGAVSIDPRVDREFIVEIEPLVPDAAAAYFAESNFNVIANPKVHLRIDDGRHYVLAAKEKFDGITMDPLDPWAKGAASLYTVEFFEAMRRHLNPGGVVTVYIQLFETNLDAVKSAVATFFEVFPHGTIWGNTYQGRGHDMVLLGQVEPPRIDLDEMEQRLARPEYDKVSQSLAEIGMNSPVDLFATYAGRKRDLRGWLRDAPINRDRNLRMQYLAGLALNADDAAAIYAGLLAYRRFPEDLFSSREGRLNTLRRAVEDREP